MEMLRSADADAENAGVVRNLDDLRQRDGRIFRPEVADEIGNQVERRLRNPVEAAADSFREAGGRQAPVREPAGRKNNSA